MPLKISVVTPVLNCAAKLELTAASADEPDVEHLIVDGGSTDATLEVAKALADKRPGRVKVLRGRDRGIFDAMNKGIAAARGGYIYFLGAGDLLLQGALAQVRASLPAHQHALVYGDSICYGKRFGGPFDWRKLCDMNICHQSIFYGRKIFERCGGYSLRYRYYADWDLNLRCFSRDDIVKRYIPVLVAEYEGGGASDRGDADFEREKGALIRRYFGLRRYLQLRWPAMKVHAAWKVRRLLAPKGESDV
jgi:glycosyltransferase involved in cell wall biosynthesis